MNAVKKKLVYVYVNAGSILPRNSAPLGLAELYGNCSGCRWCKGLPAFFAG